MPTNPFYQPGEQRAARVRDLFDSIAWRYDLINDLQSFGLHRFWKRRLVSLAKTQPGERALDLCCGTADVALSISRSGAYVIGLDFSAGMLARARQRASQSESSGIEFFRGDALKLPFRDQSFDVLTISYGLRNLADFEAGLLEMQRVVKTGGRLLVLDFGKPDNALWRSLYFAYLKGVVPLFGKVFCGNSRAYAYILESLMHYPAQRGVAETMRRIGCRNVQVINLIGGVMSINYAERA